MRRFAVTGTVRLTASKALAAAVSMTTAILLSRFLTLSEFGTYSQILLAIHLATAVFVMGLPAGIDFFLAKAPDGQEQQKFISVYYTFSTVLGFLTGLALILSAPSIIEYFNNPLIGKFIYVLAVLPWTLIVLSGLENVLRAYRKTAVLVSFRIMNSAALLLAIVAAEIFNLGFSGYMLIFLIEEAIFTAISYLYIRNAARDFRLDFDRDIIRNILAFSLPVGLASVVGFLNIGFGKLFIAQYFSAEDMAIYCNAAGEMPFTIIALSIPAVLMPRLAELLKKGNNKKSISLWGSSVTLSYTVLCFIAACLFVFAPEAVTLLYTDKYLPGVAVFRIFTVILLLRVTYFGTILHAIGRTKLIIYSAAASLAANMIFCYMFYNMFGFVGPAYATLASVALLQLMQLAMTSKNIGVPVRRLFPWKTLAFISAVNGMAGWACFNVKEWLPLEKAIGQIPETVMLVLVWGLLYTLYMARNAKKSWHEINQTR